MAEALTLNPTAASLLGLLENAGELTGADLVRVASVQIGSYWNLSRSQVYRELAALESAGYVKAGPTGPRDARPFRVTRAGRGALKHWLGTAEPSEQVRLGFLVFVAFGRHLPKGRLAALLDEQEQRHAQRLEEYRELDAHLERENADPFGRATLSFGLHYEEAVLRWLRSLPAEVRRGNA